MATITDVLRTVIECTGAETVASKFDLIGEAAGGAEERVSGLVKKAATVANVSGGIALAGAGAAIGLLKTAGAAEQAEVAFTTLLKSPQAAKKHMEDLAKFSAETPFEFAGLRETSTQLLAYGFSAESIIPMLRDLGDASAALGGDPEKLKRMVTAIGQISNKGKVSQEEINQLTEAGIPAFQILKRELGLSAEQMANIGAQGISSDKAIAALLKGMRQLYGGGMASQAKTLGGVISTIKDNLNLLATDIGRELIPMTTAAAKRVIELLEGFRGLSPMAKRAIAVLLTVGTVGAAMVSVGARITQVVGLLVLMGMQRRRMAVEAVAAEQAEQAALLKTAAALRMKAVAAGQAALAGKGSYAAANAAYAASSAAAGQAAMAGTGATATGGFAAALAPFMVPLLAIAGSVAVLGLMYKFMVGDVRSKAKADEAAAADPNSKFPDQLFQYYVRYGGEALGGPRAKKPELEEWIAAVRNDPGAGVDKSTMERYRYYQQKDEAGDLSFLERKAFAGVQKYLQEVMNRTLYVVRGPKLQDTPAGKAQIAAGTAEETLAAAEAKTARVKAEEDLVEARNGSANRGQSLTALWEEAKAHEALATKLREQAAAETDETKKKNLNADAAKQHNEALNDQADAYKMVSAAQEEVAETAKKSREQAEKDRQATLDAAQAKADYFEAIGGKGSGAARAAHGELAKLYEREAALAAQAGDVAAAYRAKAAAVDQYRQSLVDQNAVTSETMDIASAYASYLDAIGQKDAADQLRRTGMAGLAAQQASQAFANGDFLGMLRAATEAERLSRTGEEGGGGLFGAKGGRPGARTNALPPGMEGALRQSAQNINLRMTVNLRDEYGEVRKRQEIDARAAGLQALR